MVDTLACSRSLACRVELYSLDLSLAYQLAFTYIRQLAIHLRNAILNKTKESHKG